MKLEEIEQKILDFIASYRHHVLAGIASGRAGNPAKAVVHHRLSFKYLSAAEDLIKAAAKEDFSGIGDLESGITEDELYEPSHEFAEAFLMLSELFELSLSIAEGIAEKKRTNRLKYLEQDNKLLQEHYWQIRSLTEYIGRILTQSYDPDKEFLKRDNHKRESTLEEYAEITGQNETVDVTGAGHHAAPKPKEISERIKKRIVKQYQTKDK